MAAGEIGRLLWPDSWGESDGKPIGKHFREEAVDGVEQGDRAVGSREGGILCTRLQYGNDSTQVEICGNTASSANGGKQAGKEWCPTTITDTPQCKR